MMSLEERQRVAANTREPVNATVRKAMTPARRARILEAFGGCCSYPCCEVRSELQIDHTIALGLGGKDDDSNMAPLCGIHHKQKTRLDVKLIAKAKRIVKRAAGEGKSKRPILSRGFCKQFKRRFDGTVVRREETA